MLAQIINSLRRTNIYRKLRGYELDARARWEDRWSNQDFAPPWLNRGVSTALAEAVQTGWLLPDEPVIDLGCGEGDVTAWLAGQGYTVVGVDISQAAVDRARKKHPEMHPGAFQVLDLTRETLDRTFSSMVDVGCFHTVRNVFRDRYAANVSSMARPGARLLLSMKAFLGPGIDPEAEYSLRLKEVEDSFGKEFEIRRHERANIGADDAPTSSDTPTSMVFWLQRRE